MENGLDSTDINFGDPTVRVWVFRVCERKCAHVVLCACIEFPDGEAAALMHIANGNR